MLQGRIVYLSPYTKESIPHFVKWYNDAEVTRYLGMIVPSTLELHQNGYEKVARQVDMPCFLLFDKISATLIGHIGAELNQKDRVATVGILIGEEAFWDRGYGTDAMNVLIAYLFKNLDMRKAELTTFDFNTRAIKCFQKVGFVNEGKISRAKYANGELHDVIMMGLLCDDWHANRENKCHTS
jgi:RimJ/RimL family protein N-acetyltransferase